MRRRGNGGRAAGRASTRSETETAPVTRVDLERRARPDREECREGRRAAPGRPRIRLARRRREPLDDRLELVDGIERIELPEAALGGLPQPFLVGLQNLVPQEPGGRAIVAGAEDPSRERFQPVRRARQLGRPLEPQRGGVEVAEVPVVHERDVVKVLPLLRLGGDAFPEQRDRLIGTAWATRAAASLRKIAPNR